MLIHRGRYIQSGRGLGSIFSSLVRRVIPVVKSIGRSIISSPATKNIISSVKDSAINAGLNMASDVVSGENVKESFHKNLASVGENLGDSIKSELSNLKRKSSKVKPAKKRKLPRKKFGKNKKKVKFPTIFDD